MSCNPTKPQSQIVDCANSSLKSTTQSPLDSLQSPSTPTNSKQSQDSKQDNTPQSYPDRFSLAYLRFSSLASSFVLRFSLVFTSFLAYRFSPKFFLILGILFNLCLLGFFKYTDFFLENFNLFTQLAHLDFSIPLPHILLPLALSFVTFQQIAFLVDCYKKVSLSQEAKPNTESNVTDSKTFAESAPIDSQSKALSESSLLDSHSYQHRLDSQNRFTFSQKEKGFIPSSLPLAPKRIKRRFFFSANKGRASLFPCLVKNAKNALLHFFNAFLTPRQGREVVGANAPTYCNEAKPSTESKKNTQNLKAQSLDSQQSTKTTSQENLDSNSESSTGSSTGLESKDSLDSLDSINFLDYCLFITFFPQLIAGPIVHHREMMPQFARLSRNASLAQDTRILKSIESRVDLESTKSLDSKSRDSQSKFATQQCNSKAFDEKCGLQGKHEGSYLSGN
ncbi:MBOAT family O-acyltransferase, partial [uncultured Helicobacter sp.]|uniref:MBOAT family O-acyltransferase n=1 Tax=uncultured Helicobacter sp. TaxID=175537 RepID=UPI003751E5BF